MYFWIRISHWKSTTNCMKVSLYDLVYTSSISNFSDERIRTRVLKVYRMMEKKGTSKALTPYKIKIHCRFWLRLKLGLGKSLPIAKLYTARHLRRNQQGSNEMRRTRARCGKILYALVYIRTNFAYEITRSREVATAKIRKEREKSEKMSQVLRAP